MSTRSYTLVPYTTRFRAIAPTHEMLCLDLTRTNQRAETYRSRLSIFVIVSALALLLPIGALAAVPVATLSPVMVAGFLSFGLMALLYLVTEELLVEAHEKPDTPLISSMRSEEHTSELQSLMRISYAVLCLKQKTTYTQTHTHITITKNNK